MTRQGAATGRYTFETEGAPTGRGLQGFHILNEGAGCQIWKPTWGGKKTIIRPLPVRDPENPDRWDPFRLNDSPHGFGDWIRRYDMAFSIGLPGITFITQDPRDRDLDAQQNPVWMLHRSIPAAVRGGQAPSSWGPLVVGQQGRPDAISPPKDGYMMQGIIVEWNDKPRLPPLGIQPQDQQVVFLMTATAGEALIEKVSEKLPDGTWKYPDLVDLNGGAYVQFHQFGSQAPPQQGPQGGLLGAGGGGGQQKLENRYEVEILDNYNNMPPALAHLEPMLAERASRTMWDKILHIPTLEEQVRRISRCGIPASAIVYALGEAYGDMIPEEIQAQARNEMHQVSVPFSGMPGQQPGGDQPQPGAPQQLGGGQPQPGAPQQLGGGQPQPQPQQQLGGGQPQPQPQQQQQQPPSQPMPGTALGTTPTGQPQQQLGLGQAVSTPPAGPPAEQGPANQAQQPDQSTPFDPQPNHGTDERQQGTMAAIERARTRAAGNQPPQTGGQPQPAQ